MKTHVYEEKASSRPVKRKSYILKSNAQNDPRREDIAKVAYYFFEERGRRHGHDVEDWLRAVAHVCTDDKHAQDICSTGESEAPNEAKPEKAELHLAPTALPDDRGLGGRKPCPPE